MTSDSTTNESALQSNQRIGAILRDERIARGLSCEEISKECKLQEVFVRAIEDGHTDYLPTQIYFRMFARLYADTVSIDPEQLLGKLYPELPLPEKPEFAGAAYRVQGAVGAQPVGGYSRPQSYAGEIARNSGGSGNADSSSNIDSSINAVGAGVSSTTGGGGSQSGFDMSGLTSDNQDHTIRRNKMITRTLMVSAGVLALFFIAKNTVLNNGFAGDEVTPVATEQVQVTDPAALDETTEGMPTYQPREKLELTIKAKASAKNIDVVVIADGDTLFNRKMRGGEVYTWNSNYRFKLDIADKDQVEIFIGGQKLQTPEGSGKLVKGLEITQLNFEELLAAPQTSVSTK